MSNAAALRAQVSDLTSAISHQRQILDDMRTRLRNLQTQLNSITYPILSLPPELTSEIFTHCLPDERFIDVVNPGEAPLLLTRVCQTWRQIAISTPALWATFDIEDPRSLPRFAEIAQTWFERARKCPLTVSIRGNLPMNDTLGYFMDTFRRHSLEISSLELQMDLQDFVQMDSDSFELVDFPMLQKLSISIDEVSEVGVMTFNNVPLLRELFMNMAPPSFVILPWQQITKFTGELYFVDECLEAIHLMSNLLECAFSAFEFEDGDANRFETVSHPNIRHLTLYKTASDNDRSSAHILRLLTLPALQTLKFFGTDNFDAKEFDSFLKRSSPPLRKLAVRPLEGEIELRLSQPFLALIDLVELEIWCPAWIFMYDFFDLIGSNPSLLPRLQKLAFLGCLEEDEATIEEILHNAAEPIIKRRGILPGCARLQSFRLISRKHAQYSEENLLPFRKLKTSGMDVYIGTEKRSAL